MALDLVLDHTDPFDKAANLDRAIKYDLRNDPGLPGALRLLHPADNLSRVKKQSGYMWLNATRGRQLPWSLLSGTRSQVASSHTSRGLRTPLSLFLTASPMTDEPQIHCFLNMVTLSQLNVNGRALLSGPVTKEEIVQFISAAPYSKMPGEHGFPAEFYKLASDDAL
ncbi:hypothetical protein NDU88_003398 [Pleurodeles waltl]|uniref:Uncharacterized protein n=1 Tax=Pleurodeles waltl TaxID=8319 RepID=A0AAV7T563_PLEWA|nr:hypothetical protein NDU88_003398 [Pleurodeles waltl]